MALPNRAATSVLFVAALAGLCPAQEWTEAGVVQKFLDQSPQAREARARVAIAEAATRGRVLYADEDDRFDPVRFKPAAFLIEAKTRIVDVTVPVDRRRALEAVPLTHDRVDDVDLDDSVPGFDVGNRLRRV